MMSRKPATIRDVARDAGMSVATVSRAIRYPHLLSKDTLEKVNAVIAQLGYRPNLAAQNLRGTKTDLVLIVVPSLSPFFLEICRGAEAAAGESGYNVLMGHTGRQIERERHLLEETDAGRADGAIVVTSVDLLALTGSGRLPPAILALDVSNGTGLPIVRADHTAGAEEATLYLAGLGHRRIAHIKGSAASGMTQHRLEGYLAALQKCGLAAAPGLIVDGDFTLESGEAAMETLLTLEERPTAVFAANDQMALGAIRTLRRAGLRVPEDMSVIGFDDERIAALYDPPLSTVRIPTYEIGYWAMKQMARLLAGEKVEPDIVLETELAIRRSTAAPADIKAPGSQ